MDLTKECRCFHCGRDFSDDLSAGNVDSCPSDDCPSHDGKEIINKLIDGADIHGSYDDPDHTVGDLQDLLRAAWRLLPSDRRRQFLESEEVNNLVESIDDDEFSDIVSGFRAQ